MRHIAVVGAGAIGCYLAARLSERGHRITLVARGAQRMAIARGGLLLREPHGEERRYYLHVVESLDERPDLLLLTVKTQDVAVACAALRSVAGGVPLVALQNGVQAEHIAAAALGREQVLGAVALCAVTYLQAGEVSVQFPGWLVLGEAFRHAGERAQAIAATLNAAIPTYLTQHLRRVRWSKVISNLNNALCAASGLTLPEVGSTSTGRLLSLRVMQEGYMVTRAAGIPLDHGLYALSLSALRRDRTTALIALLQASFPTVLARLPDRLALVALGAASRSRLNQLPVRASTWQSIARDRPTEIDYLNGEIVRLGTRLGVATPYNAHLVTLVREVARTHAFLRIDDLMPAAERRAAPRSAPGGAR
jgi:2-dehydropantoate 2-reductase